jgi:hypothetical protein
VLNSPDTLQTFLEFMVKNGVDDDRIYAYLAKPNVVAIRRHLGRFQRVESAPRSQAVSAKDWIIKQNRVKGKCFEQIMKALIPRMFSTWVRVQTTTNEIDVLVGLGPTSLFVPALREWGVSFICECKSERGHFSVTWVDKLSTVLETHGTKVGVILSASGPKKTGNGRRAIDKIRLLAVLQKFIVTLDLDDVTRCLNGTNSLRLLTTRYMETKMGIERTRLLMN